MEIDLAVCLSALAFSVSTMFVYFAIAGFVFNTVDSCYDAVIYPKFIASFSLIASVLGSSTACGTFLGIIAPSKCSHPTRNAAVVSTAFVLVQLWQLALFEDIPVWLTIITIFSFPPFCMCAAKIAAKCMAECRTTEVVASASAAADASASALADASTAVTSADTATALASPAEPSLPTMTAAPNAAAAPGTLDGAAAHAAETTPPAESGRAAAEPTQSGGGGIPVIGWLLGRLAALKGDSDARRAGGGPVRPAEGAR